MTVVLICLFLFLTVFCSLLALGRWFFRDERQIYMRLFGQVKGGKGGKINASEREGSASGPDLKRFLRNVSGIFAPQGLTKRLEKELLKADIPLRGEEYLTLRVLAVLVPGAVILVVARQVILSLVVCAAGFFLPGLLVSIAQRKKLAKFDHQLVDSLSIIANALRAGYSFLQSVELVSREMPDPIGGEFAKTFREISLGTSTEESLQNLAARVGSDDLELVVTAVLIQRQTGGNLAEILESISLTIRERVRIQGEVKTLTAQGRISGLVIGLIPPGLVLLISLINPVYMKPLLSTPVGWALLAGGAVSELLGVLIIRRIIAIDYI